MHRHLGLAAAVLMTALIAGAVIAGPRDSLNLPRDRSVGAVSLADFRQLQAEVQGLKQQVVRLQRRLDALSGRKGGAPRGGPGHMPGCPQCP